MGTLNEDWKIVAVTIKMEDNRKELLGSTVIKSHVERPILSLKYDKAPGQGKVHDEMLKIMCEAENNFLHTVTDLFNGVYNERESPKD